MPSSAAPLLSVVSPVYGTSSLIPVLCQRIKTALSAITEEYEIILVFDGSPDDGWERICRECEVDPRITGIELSRNFGQHYAITAGLTHASGQWVIVMDCDLQDRPEEIPNLYAKAQEGYDVVLAQRAVRQDTWFKRMSSKAFYAVLSYMTRTQQDASVANFGIYRRNVIDAVLSLGDRIRYFPVMVSWIGFRRTKLPVAHAEREEGKSAYTLFKQCRMAMDVILSFSNRPLHLLIWIGSFISLAAFAVASFYLLLYIMGSIEVTGYASLIISIWFLSGFIIMSSGILGVYIGKLFDQAKARPTYIVRTIRQGTERALN